MATKAQLIAIELAKIPEIEKATWRLHDEQKMLLRDICDWNYAQISAVKATIKSIEAQK
jgi:hypothetical protein